MEPATVGGQVLVPDWTVSNVGELDLKRIMEFEDPRAERLRLNISYSTRDGFMHLVFNNGLV